MHLHRRARRLTARDGAIVLLLMACLAGIPIPVPAGVPASYNPIHEDDIIATIPKLLAAASVPEAEGSRIAARRPAMA